MNRLKLWLSVHDIAIESESVTDGRVFFRLRLPNGAELPAAFGEDALEDNPDGAIHYLEMIVAKLAG